MFVSEKLTQQKLIDLLLCIYKKENEFIYKDAKDLIAELKMQILSIISE